MAKEKRIEIEIYGQRYPLRADSTAELDEEYVRGLGAFVDRRMREVAESTATVDSLKVAVLAALKIADDYFQLKLEADQLDDTLAERVQAIQGLLDEPLEAVG